MSEKEKMQITLDHIHDMGLADNDDKIDKDYMRNDLEDAGDEEMEDRLIEAARKKRMPLNIEEVNRISRNNFDGANLSKSVLSGVMNVADVQELMRQSRTSRMMKDGSEKIE